MVLPSTHPELPWTVLARRHLDPDRLLLRPQPVHRPAHARRALAAPGPARHRLRRGALAADAVRDRDARHHRAPALRRRSWRDPTRPTRARARADPAGPARLPVRGARRRGHQHAGVGAQLGLDHLHDGPLPPAPAAGRGRGRGWCAVGRWTTVVFLLLALRGRALAAAERRRVPFIQEFQGYISPGVVAAFVFGFAVPVAPPAAGVAALLLSAPVYGALQWTMGGVPYLHRMLLTLVVLLAVMAAITLARPLAEPRRLPVRDGFDMAPSRRRSSWEAWSSRRSWPSSSSFAELPVPPSAGGKRACAAGRRSRERTHRLSVRVALHSSGEDSRRFVRASRRPKCSIAR